MATFLFAYLGGGMPDSDAERTTITAAWEAWYEKLGSAVLDAGVRDGDGRIEALETVEAI